MQVKLDETNWANLKEVSDLRRGDRKAVNEKIIVEATTDGRPIIRQSMDDDVADAVLEHVVLDWSLPLPLPAADPYRPAVISPKGELVSPENIGSLNKLTIPQADALYEAIKPHVAALTGQSAPVKENETPTADSAS